MINFKEYLKEYLTDEQRSRYSGIKMSKVARSDTDHFFGKDNDHVREDLIGHQPDKSEVHNQIEKHLGKEIHVDDYKKGLTKDQHGRDVKIGRLVKDEKLRNQFANDSTRQGVKSSKSHYVTVVRGTEVAGQTNSASDAAHPTGHSWGDQSCKNVDNGSNRHFIEHEVKHGSVVVRVHDHNDQEIYRATLHPHHNDKNHVAYAVDSEYGVKQSAFTNHAHNIANRLSGQHKGGSLLYIKHKKVYNDNDESELIHPKATKEDIESSLNDKDDRVREAAMRHPDATVEHIGKALNDEKVSIRSAAIKHPNATVEHIGKALNDKDDRVRSAAIEHPNATVEHVGKALNDESASVRVRAIEHPNATTEHINKALNDKDERVREAAIRHPNATAEHINKALNDKDGFVRSAAIQHPAATAEHIGKALNDEKVLVRLRAIEHPNATAEHIGKALNDENVSVRATAIKHPNATADHINKALNDENEGVRATAIKHPNATNVTVKPTPKPTVKPTPKPTVKKFKNYIKFH